MIMIQTSIAPDNNMMKFLQENYEEPYLVPTGKKSFKDSKKTWDYQIHLLHLEFPSF